MATALKLRRGTTTQHATFTGLEGEVTVDTTKDTVVVHDGTTAGGFPLVGEKGDQTITGIKTFDNGLKTDTISEETSAAGVTIDGVLLKDSEVTTDVIKEKTSAAGVTIDSVLLKDGGVGSAASPATLNSLAYPTEASIGFRNRIINGDMRIDQRNAGAAVTVNTDTVFSVDRFFGLGQTTDGVFTLDQNTTAPAGFVNSVVATVTTADASIGANQYYSFNQYIEGTNVADLAWGTASAKTVTLSFWVRSSLTGTFGGAISNSAQNRSYPFTYSIYVADTWEYKTVTIAGDTSGTWLTTTGIGIRLFFDLGIGSNLRGTAGSWAGSAYLGATGATNVIGTLNATWYITGVQLEVGSVATPFERRPYGTELALCQRYYQKWVYTLNSNVVAVGTCVGTATAYANFPFYFPMRTEPVMTIPGTGTSNGQWAFLTSTGQYPGTVGTIVADKIETFSCRLACTGATGAFTAGNSTWLYSNSGSPTVTASAEL